MNVYLKAFLAALALCAWGYFALKDPKLVDGFIQAVRDCLIALGAFQAGNNTKS
jgi:hypothetical protein